MRECRDCGPIIDDLLVALKDAESWIRECYRCGVSRGTRIAVETYSSGEVSRLGSIRAAIAQAERRDNNGP